MNTNLILCSIAVFLVIILVLVIILLVAKKYLSPSGNVTITINGKDKVSVPQGGSLLSTMSEQGIFLPSACGGKGSCGQCKVQVPAGGGEILDSEKGHFTRKQVKENWRLGCQCKVKSDMEIKVDDSVMGVKEWAHALKASAANNIVYRKKTLRIPFSFFTTEFPSLRNIKI